jgi:NitT/TauT family transport system substrate-binding protein
MKNHIVGLRTRREFWRRLTATGAASLFGVRSAPLAAEPSPETRRVRLSKVRGICIAPQYVAEGLLRAEGFTDVQYVFGEAGTAQARALASGEVDINVNFAAPLVVSLDAGPSIVVLAGVHTGCFELFGNDRVRSIRDLKGKTVGTSRRATTTRCRS